MDQSELRAKYVEWCSARLSDRLAEYSTDALYELAEQLVQDVEASQNGEGSGRGTLPVRSYRDVVHVLLEHWTDTLPTFDAWAAAYREDPREFEKDLTRV